MRVVAVGCLLIEASYVIQGDPDIVPWLVLYNSNRYLLFAILFFESSQKKDIPYIHNIFKVGAVFWILHIVREIDMIGMTLVEYNDHCRTNSELVSFTYLSVSLLLILAGYFAISPLIYSISEKVKRMHK